MNQSQTEKNKATSQQPISTMELDEEAHCVAVLAAEQELVTILAKLVLAAVEQGSEAATEFSRVEFETEAKRE